MKRIISIMLVLLMIFCFVSCSKENNNIIGTNALVKLPKDATLHIGTGETFVNYFDESQEEVYLTYVSHITYKLNRTRMYYSSDNIPNNYVPTYEGSRYYYYWTIEKETTQELLGKRTITSEITYSYLPYADGECVMVKKTTVASYSYNYQGGFVDKAISYTIDLNGYFNNYEEMAAAYPDLGALAYIGNTSDRYYVDTTPLSRTTTSKDEFSNTYYYITYYNSDLEQTVQ